MPGNQAKNNGEPTETRGRLAVDILQKIVESNTALEVGLVSDIDTYMQLQFRTYDPPKFLLTKKCYATRKAGLVNFIVRDSRIAILFFLQSFFFILDLANINFVANCVPIRSLVWILWEIL